MLSLLKLCLFSYNFGSCRHFWSVIFMSCIFMSCYSCCANWSLKLTQWHSVCLDCLYTERSRRKQKQQHLWQFLLETLSNPKYNPCYIEWLDRSRGIFRFVESQKIARLWGLRRKRDNMCYEYFSRAMRSVAQFTQRATADRRSPQAHGAISHPLQSKK